MRERLTRTLEVDTSHMHAPGAPPGDYFGTRSETMATFAEYARARCPESEAQSTADNLQRETRTKVTVRIGRALGAECPG